MKPSTKRCALLVASSSLLAAASASAANSFYNAGDLMLTFQKVGSTNTVYADLGNAATQFRGSSAGADSTTTRINFMDLNTTLTDAFGAGWASDPQVYAGLAGVYSTNSSNSIVVNGDASRTLYVSAARDSVGTIGDANSLALSVATNTLVTTAAAAIQSQNNILGTYTNVAQTVSTTDISQIDDKQPITVFSGNNMQGVAFGAFDGGVQQQGSASTLGSFGPAGEAEFALDLYRIVGKTVAGAVAGDLRSGTYEGTVVIGSTGMVSFVPEPSSLALCGLAAGALVLRRRRCA